MKKNATIITTLSLVGITILSGIVLANSKVSADDSAVDTTTITVPISCTMSGNIATGQEHSATLQPGTYSGASGSDYENGIGKTTLTTFCNDDNGFSIYAVGFTGDTMEGENHTKLVGTAASNNATIPTKVYESTDTTSNWSMKVTKVENPSGGDPITYNPQNMIITNSFNNWHIVPDTYTKVAEYKATTGTSTTDTTLGAKVETTYAAYVSTSQPADTYTGKVKYTMVHPYTEEPLAPQSATPGCINYFANASTAVGTMGCQDTREIDWSSCNTYTDHSTICVVDGNVIDIDTLPRLDSYKTSQTLLASNYSRNGYGFAGWSDSFDYATNPNAKFYGPQETVTFSEDTLASGTSLYAVWIKSQGSIQDQSKVASVCNSLTTAPTDGTANLTSVSALTDQRDNNTYAIAKLADGKCWMIENLRLESTAEHNSDGTLAQGYGTSATDGNFGGLANAESANFSYVATANSLYYSGTQEGAASIDIGTSNNPDYRMPRYNNINTSTRASSPTGYDNNIYSYGNYYTWHAAIADLTYNGTNNQSTTGTSLCPAGWHLPTGGMAYATGGTSGVNVTGDTSTFREFYNLGYKTMDEVKTAYEDTPNNGYAYYSSNTTNTAGKTATAAIRSFPNNFLYSGYFSSSSAYTRGSFGYYWSSTAYNNHDSYRLNLNSSGVYPGTNYYSKYNGYSIRCTVATP